MLMADLYCDTGEKATQHCKTRLKVKKKGNPAMCNSTEESRGYYAKWNEQVTKKITTAWLHVDEDPQIVKLTERE